MIISLDNDKKTPLMIEFVSFSAKFRLDTRSVNPSAGPKFIPLYSPPPDARTPNCLICSTLQKLLSIKKPAQRYSRSLPPDIINRGTTTTYFHNNSITYCRLFVNLSGPYTIRQTLIRFYSERTNFDTILFGVLAILGCKIIVRRE